LTTNLVRDRSYSFLDSFLGQLRPIGRKSWIPNIPAN